MKIPKVLFQIEPAVRTLLGMALFAFGILRENLLTGLIGVILLVTAALGISVSIFFVKKR